MAKKSVFSDLDVLQYIKKTIEESPDKSIAFETIAAHMDLPVSLISAAYNGTGGYKKYPSPIYKNGDLFKSAITEPVFKEETKEEIVQKVIIKELGHYGTYIKRVPFWKRLYNCIFKGVKF